MDDLLIFGDSARITSEAANSGWYNTVSCPDTLRFAVAAIRLKVWSGAKRIKPG
jgi:hypothetical protein